MKRVAPASGASGELHVERALPNGDVYKGDFLAGSPHGKGKYVWADGCMYDGQWRRGKASGKGRFSWPSGATFEGDFRAGRIDGRGVFVGPDGATYRGSWAADRSHGHGAKSYANGYRYEGIWENGTPKSPGAVAPSPGQTAPATSVPGCSTTSTSWTLPRAASAPRLRWRKRPPCRGSEKSEFSLSSLSHHPEFADGVEADKVGGGRRCHGAGPAGGRATVDMIGSRSGKWPGLPYQVGICSRGGSGSVKTE